MTQFSILIDPQGRQAKSYIKQYKATINNTACSTTQTYYNLLPVKSQHIKIWTAIISQLLWEAIPQFSSWTIGKELANWNLSLKRSISLWLNVCNAKSKQTFLGRLSEPSNWEGLLSHGPLDVHDFQLFLLTLQGINQPPPCLLNTCITNFVQRYVIKSWWIFTDHLIYLLLFYILIID